LLPSSSALPTTISRDLHALILDPAFLHCGGESERSQMIFLRIEKDLLPVAASDVRFAPESFAG
jgi:hypothetical protein